MIWKRPFTLQALDATSRNTMVEHLGITFTDFGDDYLEASMPVDHRTKQPMGLLHGGASAVLAETIGSVASSLCLEEGSQRMPVGVEINANHLRSAMSGRVTARATPYRVGKSMHVWNIEIRDEKQQLICVSRLTIAVVNAR